MAPDGSEIVENGRAGDLVYAGPNVMMGYAQSPDDLTRGPDLLELKTNDIAVNSARTLRASASRPVFARRCPVRPSGSVDPPECAYETPYSARASAVIPFCRYAFPN